MTDQETLQELADVVAAGTCVWFAGAGLSLEAGMPKVSQLTVELLENAFVRRRGPWNEEELHNLWERLKRLLVDPEYEVFAGNRLQRCNSLLEVASEIACFKELATQWPQERWVERLLNLGRVAEVLQLAVPDREEADVVLARLMGFETAAGEAAPLWDKPPGYSHHLLALLIKEGRVPSLLTTNYDLLVEQACQDAGVPLQVVANREDLHVASLRMDRPPFTYYKLHGCLGWYRRALGDPAALQKACQALVIMDRQLQNWRGDEWAHHVLGASLREHPVLFVGYSGSEPVLINTLNSVVGELQNRSLGKLFVAGPALSYSFYQLFGLAADFDPLHPSHVVPLRGKQFLATLYPKAMARYYRAEAGRAGEHDAALAAGRWLCPDPALLPTANEKAAHLMAVWLETVAEELVQPETYPIDYSPLSFIVQSLLSRRPGYVTLADMRTEYTELVRQFGLALAYNFPALEQVRTVSGKHEGSGAPTFDLVHPGKLVRVVLVPARRGGSASARLQAEVMQYLERRSRIERSGTYAFLCACDLEEDHARRIFAEVSASYGSGYQVQLWNRSAVYLSEGGNSNV